MVGNPETGFRGLRITSHSRRQGTIAEASRSSISEVLADIDMLIDGAYVDVLADGAGTWTGSGNQRVIDMRETRRAGQIVLYGVVSLFLKTSHAKATNVP